MPADDVTCWVSDRRCPDCGAVLMESARHEWCAAVVAGVLCRFGIRRKEPPRATEARTGTKGALAGFAGDLEGLGVIAAAGPGEGQS